MVVLRLALLSLMRGLAHMVLSGAAIVWENDMFLRCVAHNVDLRLDGLFVTINIHGGSTWS